MNSKEHRQLIKQIQSALRQNPQLEQIMADYMDLDDTNKDKFVKSVYSLLRAKTMN